MKPWKKVFAAALALVSSLTAVVWFAPSMRSEFSTAVGVPGSEHEPLESIALRAEEFARTCFEEHGRSEHSPREVTEDIPMPGTDPEWDSFPRRDTPFEKMLLTRAGQLDAAQVYRLCDLNPKDRYLEPGRRAMIAALVGDYDRKLGVLVEAYRQCSAKEVDILLSTQTLKPSRQPDVERRSGGDRVRRRVKVLPDTITRVTADGVYDVSPKDLPYSTRIRAALRLLTLEFGGALINRYEGLGLLTREETGGLLARLSARVGSRR